MKTRTLTMAELSQCRAHRLDPQHWIPEHKTEQCEPAKRAELAKIEAELHADRKRKIQELKSALDQQLIADLERAILRIRQEGR